ncbi:methyltransferase family protein [Roseivivax isoporae]|uniref:Uncharacterized protein n=1 Tax=Roseivivax isoporae LMG 25204 TaxID=1449351 RepID=X7F558_9RHOB|nr:hypothetical protein [Roseivivax isoporae]ETX27204.1 hypothetical protein RISW2_15215 [Roseivivax isoporae LMG 25204]
MTPPDTARTRPPQDPHPVWRLVALVAGLLDPPPGRPRILAAWAWGILCHLVFAAAILAMVVGLWSGMTAGIGAVPWPWAALANLALLVQFPFLHSLLLNTRAGRVLPHLAPGGARGHGRTLVSTTYTIIASLQLLALFTLWTPSGIVWWRAEGTALWIVAALHGASWLFLMKSNLDAGAELQSGALGWMSMVQDRAAPWPDMPVRGLFRVIRQPIYVGFSLVLWTVPVWTPDQLLLAAGLTAYNLIAPGALKERRYRARFGDRFARYQARVPYILPGARPSRAPLTEDPADG